MTAAATKVGEELAREILTEGASFVSDASAEARRLDEWSGYRLAAERTVVKEGWANAGVNQARARPVMH